jgi:hypothetical protein
VSSSIIGTARHGARRMKLTANGQVLDGCSSWGVYSSGFLRSEPVDVESLPLESCIAKQLVGEPTPMCRACAWCAWCLQHAELIGFHVHPRIRAVQ